MTFLIVLRIIIQEYIISEIKQQSIGTYYGLQADEVTDRSNWEQLGIVLRYTKNCSTVERLIEYPACKTITGQAICNDILSAFRKLGMLPL